MSSLPNHGSFWNLIGLFTIGIESKDFAYNLFSQVASGEKNVTYVDRITPVERRLYFTTANAHFKSGCPMLGLEVLQKLPEVIDLEMDITKSRSNDSVGKTNIHSGILDDFNKSANNSELDWSQPLASSQNKDNSIGGMDWSQPFGSSAKQMSNDIDWGAPVNKFEDEELKLDWGDDKVKLLSFAPAIFFSYQLLQVSI